MSYLQFKLHAEVCFLKLNAYLIKVRNFFYVKISFLHKKNRKKSSTAPRHLGLNTINASDPLLILVLS